jgi:hypothetical protein
LRFIDDAFPLLVAVSAPVFDEAEVRSMADGFERYFARGERYALINASSRGAPVPAPKERRAIADWANHPRVRDFSKRLCVGAATIVESTMARATLSVIMAIWKPAMPHEVSPGLEPALDYCLQRLREERMTLSKPPDLIRYEMLALLKNAI